MLVSQTNHKKLHKMKKIAISLLFLGVFIQPAMAQFRFGINTTPHWSWLTTNDKKIEGAGAQFGFRFGLTGDFFLDDEENYAITTGLNMSFNQGGTLQNGYTQGVFWPNSDLSETRFDTLPLNAQLTYHLNYLEVPFGFKLRGGLGDNSPVKFYIELPVITLGFLIGANGDISNTVGKNTEDENIRDDVNGLAVSWGLGAGAEYELNESATLYGGLFFQNQFTDVTKDKNAFVIDGTTRKNEDSNAHVNTLALKIGVYF